MYEKGFQLNNEDGCRIKELKARDPSDSKLVSNIQKFLDNIDRVGITVNHPSSQRRNIQAHPQTEKLEHEIMQTSQRYTQYPQLYCNDYSGMNCILLGPP